MVCILKIPTLFYNFMFIFAQFCIICTIYILSESFGLRFFVTVILIFLIRISTWLTIFTSFDHETGDTAQVNC